MFFFFINSQNEKAREVTFMLMKISHSWYAPPLLNMSILYTYVHGSHTHCFCTKKS